MAINTVWLTSEQFCEGTLAEDPQKYAYRNFARPAIFLQDHLPSAVKDLFAYTLYIHVQQFNAFWTPNYDEAFQQANDAIDTDEIYNLSDVLLAYVLWHETANERLQYMKGYTRYLERFLSYSVGTTNGIKVDGSGFHHWTAYNNYMYAYNTLANNLYYLDSTGFQIDSTSFEVFRNAIMAQYVQSNDVGIQALSTSGRKPEVRDNQFSQTSLKRAAISGGIILGLSTADTILAGEYNRIYGVDGDFNYSSLATFREGFFQLNHAHASAYRKNNWLAFNKGFSNNMWGNRNI